MQPLWKANSVDPYGEVLHRIALGEGILVNPPGNINPPPGSVGAGFRGNVCIGCHNNQEIQTDCSDLDSYLRNHPGDAAGPCQVTPAANP